MKPRLLNYCFFLILSLLICSCFSKKEKHINSNRIYTKALNEIDGPYIYGKNDSLSIITVQKDKDSSFYIFNTTLKRISGQQFTCNVNNSDKDSFSFSLIDSYKFPKTVYKSPEKLFVTSDIEGNFNAFYSLLVSNNVMDENYNWVFGRGHLVICGDMVDRGNNAWACLWLLYKLEQDAKKAGGMVHYILGNHDVMNMHANLKYVKRRYIELAKILSGKEDEKEAYRDLLSDTNELAKWIASKNCVEKIGNSLYLHGGISEDVVDANLSLDRINGIVRKNIRVNLTSNPGENELDNLVFSRMGPLWYRGLVTDYNSARGEYSKINQNSLDEILKFFSVDRLVIGHTIVDDKITSDFNGKVIRVDIKHSNEKFTGKSEALFIEQGNYFRVNDSGEKFKLSIE